MRNPVGFRFHPTDQELISFYLYNMILGDVCLVDEAISEVNMCKFDPWELCSLSKIQSDDPVWYFFSPRDSKYMNSKRTNRTTRSGYWKATGIDRKIRAKRGSRLEIGIKKTLVFYTGRVPNGKRTHWVMHEYHATSLPLEKRTHVVCKIKYKGEDVSIPSGNSSESHSLGSDLNNAGAINTEFEADVPVEETSGSFYSLYEHDSTVPLIKQAGLALWEVQSPNEFSGSANLQQQTTYLTQGDDEFLSGLKHVDRRHVETLFAEDEQVSCLSMRENCNDYRPQKSLTGVYVDYSSDSDAESISATSHQETLSPVDSVDSFNGHYPTHMEPFRVNEILQLGTGDHKQAPTTGETSIRIRALKSQSQPETINIEAPKRPIQLQSVSKHHHMKPPKEEVEEGTEQFRATGHKNPDAEETDELKVTQETNKKTNMGNTKKKGLFIFQETTERSRKNPPYIYLMNLIIGFTLCIAIICEIIWVH